ncbi:hypothetical protein LL962_16735 [Xanthomonas sp. NCPPB 1067]|uniref:hypothetical protein n=1 Tax=Xanthomonas sp. NCPPB 1067 TaxID=487524 RepID=UPI001E4A1A64|nr:hypothetical protein [Xanthomonas sp. NCPPB 1067]MCC4588727.1 hypothetical protein [Xanthomonas sp. NCPPB 1067]
MNWIQLTVAICIPLAGGLAALAVKKPRVCLRISDYFIRITFGGLSASVFGVAGLGTANMLVKSDLQTHQKILTAGGSAGVDAIRSTLDSAVWSWMGISAFMLALCATFVAAERLSQMVLDDHAEAERVGANNEGHDADGE